MESLGLTTDMLIVLGVVVATIVLFLTEWLRVDVVAILVMVSLPLLGVIDPHDTFKGLSSNAVISVIAVVIIGRGLDHVGVVNQLVKPIIRLGGRSRAKIIILSCGAIGVVSSFMQNVGAAALFLPAMRRLSRHSGIPLSKLLMPVAFSAILGGTVTLVGSSPMIMLNDLIRPYGIEPWGLFDVAPMGLALVVSGIIYFVLFGNILLPGGKGGEDEEKGADVKTHYPKVGDLWELMVPAGFTASLAIDDLCESYEIQPIALRMPQSGEVIVSPDRIMMIEPGAKIAAYGEVANMKRLAADHGFTYQSEVESFSHYLEEDYAGVVEGVVAPHSAFVGRTMLENRFRHSQLMVPLALTQNAQTMYSGFQDKVLSVGDSILLHSSWDHFQSQRPQKNILFARSVDHEIMRPELAKRALASFGVAMALVIFGSLPLSVCLMIGALLMIVSGVLSIDEAYQGVDWRTVFLLGGLIPLGGAMQQTGTAAWIADTLLGLLGTPPQFVFILFVGAITTFFSLVVSNAGACVLLVPLVVDMAGRMGVDPRLAAMVVAVACSNCFLLPTHQVNALYMGPGRYKSIDFLRVGAPFTLISLFVITCMATVFY
ncbi:SLC13 family permease [Desulfotalea psychrophila]|uniref:Related to sodium-dependent transporter n=1 Tax=Desulfotalea psychrophila (strain LSv54 / DSM 12343) TaxID=177439 RepID=Q6ANA4_DESPS|nr:SLC13 family permease [Desulfotalea psychrophila]CAG36170.1 related to sodium-dependent transporter [Desulfotalea psychrophila LSv54]